MSKALVDIINESKDNDVIALARKALLDSGYTIAKIPLHQFQEL
jgi:hypothetical protein